MIVKSAPMIGFFPVAGGIRRHAHGNARVGNARGGKMRL
jgi:hypothetical protein